MLREAYHYGRMAWYFGQYLRMPSQPNPRSMLHRNIEQRHENFLELLRAGVFNNPKTPYFHLMRLAGCELQDLEGSVRRDGLESTLEKLRSEGVYLTHAEAKGAPVERHGKTISNFAGATANPVSPGGIESISSGSRSMGTATPSSNLHRRYREIYEALAREELDVTGRAFATLQPILPAPGGLMYCASMSIAGRPAEQWFTAGGTIRDAAPYRAAMRFLVAEARILGHRIPYPVYLDTDDFQPVVKWIDSIKSSGRAAFFRSNVSACTRVCAAARDTKVDISGTIFLTSGEAITSAKRELINSVGVLAYPRYVASELGTIGIGCRHLKGNSVHLFSDSVTAITHRRLAPFADVEVDSLLLTSTNPYSSRIFINTELDDAGELTAASCDCVFSRAGYRHVIQNIQSFGKLTGHGLTLAGNQFLDLLESRLPARFGGAPGDYQLVEEQGTAQVEVRLRVSPRIGRIDPSAVHSFFMSEVRGVFGGAISRRTWEQTGSLHVEIAEPYRTRTGKVLPLHLAEFGSRNGH